MIFENRREGAKQLATQLMYLANENTIILALPKGGVPVGYEISEVLHVPLSVIVSQKIGHPLNPELGLGAVSEENTMVFDESYIQFLGLSGEDLQERIQQSKEKVVQRIALYRNNKPLPSLSGKIVLLVDDGLATGITAKAAIAVLHKKHPHQIIFGSPVCAQDTSIVLQKDVDRVVCITKPYTFASVGVWYKHFPEITDEEVVNLLHKMNSISTEKQTCF